EGAGSRLDVRIDGRPAAAARGETDRQARGGAEELAAGGRWHWRASEDDAVTVRIAAASALGGPGGGNPVVGSPKEMWVAPKQKPEQLPLPEREKTPTKNLSRNGRSNVRLVPEQAVMADYECDGCGACCRTFPIFASSADAAREPRIAAEGRKLPQ